MHDCAATWSSVFLNYKSWWMCSFILMDSAWKMLVSIHITWSHGHIITNRLDDSEDIYSRRCNLIGQINSILCYFRDLDSVVKARLMKCYCFSMYGCILWDFNNTQVVFLQSMAQGNETVFWPAIWLKFIYFACALSYVASVSWNVQAICAFYH